MMHADFVIISDRPELIEARLVNGSYQLHNEHGPSTRWRDGWSLWHIEGVAVDEQIVMRPETQTIEQIASEKNEEVRRIRIERYGWERYLIESGAKMVDSRRNDIDCQDETLFEYGGNGEKRLVCVDPSTGRRYALGVPREVTTTTEAQRWISGGLSDLTVHSS